MSLACCQENFLNNFFSPPPLKLALKNLFKNRKLEPVTPQLVGSNLLDLTGIQHKISLIVLWQEGDG